MELRHLRYFVAVAAERSFSRASEKLHIAQPPLSRQIQQLEEELGTKLLHRGRPITLTDSGRYFFEQALQVLQRTDEEIARVWELVGGFRGYAFCRAHSTAYAVEAYQGAYLKRHHPAEFLACVLGNGKGFYSTLAYTLECRRLGIGFLAPDVNTSRWNFATSASGGLA